MVNNDVSMLSRSLSITAIEVQYNLVNLVDDKEETHKGTTCNENGARQPNTSLKKILKKREGHGKFKEVEATG